jgi:hypothetical protein
MIGYNKNMSATYCSITEAEMDQVLKAEKGWTKTQTLHAMEIVYEYRLKKAPAVVIKVYSSVHKNNGLSRSCGEDAIRVCAVNTVSNRGVWKTKRVNRVPNWENRLKDRVMEIIESFKK